MEDKIELINLILEPSIYQCTIDAKDVDGHLNLVSEFVVGKMKSHSAYQDGYSLIYHYDEALAHKLLDFCLKEGSCCGFFTFNLEFVKSKNLLKLHISSVDSNVEVSEIIKEMLKL